ncbi:MAG: 2-C-methyl-D-erythritol 4-phosphate cytidylyltransferase [Clostridia bacterium]|nr:2-C-methyl-D-erythritol 4-phosphate cytidylyltransferase [Clostridia bacterium]
MQTIAKEKSAALSLFPEASCVALIAAAGSSVRMNRRDKLFLPLGDKPVLAHTLLTYQGCSAIGAILLSVREDRVADVQKLCDEYEITKLRAIVVGGQTRADSVKAAVAQLEDGDRYLAIADGDRPLTTAREIENTLEEAMRYSAAICAVPVHDTIKQTDAQGLILTTPDRATLWAAQTPQIFAADLYRKALKALAECGGNFTDDSGMVEASGIPVRVVRGSDENIKITTPTDLLLAEAIWRERQL